MKVLVALLSVVVAYLMFDAATQRSRIAELERNVAIAVLSAEIANNKIGAFAPYFGEDKEKFVESWLDGVNMPLAVFDTQVINDIKSELRKKRSDPVSKQQYDSLMKQRGRY